MLCSVPTYSYGVECSDDVCALGERAHERGAHEVPGEEHQRPPEAAASQLLAIGLHLRGELAGSSSGLLLVGHVQVVQVVEVHDVEESGWLLLRGRR